LNQKNEKEFFLNVSSAAITQLFHYYSMRSLPLISYELLFKIGNCKSAFFVNAYIEKIKTSFIDPNIKRPYENPLDKLLQVDQEFEKQKKESKIVKDLIDYCFGKSDDKLTEKNVMQELIKNPRVDHQWYRMIENSRKYQSQKQVNHITDLIHKIAQNLWH
jgi:hypothetical protein